MLKYFNENPHITVNDLAKIVKEPKPTIYAKDDYQTRDNLMKSKPAVTPIEQNNQIVQNLDFSRQKTLTVSDDFPVSQFTTQQRFQKT